MVGSSNSGVTEDVSFSRNMLSKLKNMRGKRSGIIFGAVLGGALSSIILFLFFVAILGFILIAIVGVIVPYLMGLKKLLHILIYGLGLMVVLSFVFAGAYTHYVYLLPPHVNQDSSHNTTTGYYFKEGAVTPTQGDASTVFSFTAQLYHPSSGSGNLSVYVVVDKLLSNGTALNATMSPVSNTTLTGGSVLTSYVYNTTLPGNQLYQLQFKTNISGVWVLTTITVSPWTSTPSNTFVTLIFPSFSFVMVSISLLFFGLELVIWLVARSKTRRDQILKARVDKNREEGGRDKKRSEALQAPSERKAITKKEKFICTSCGAEVGKDDTQCPKCGEKFD